MVTRTVDVTTGPCAPWCDADQLAEAPGLEDVDAGILEDATVIASDILFALSGRQFAGGCDGYVRPVARPRGLDDRSFASLLGGAYSPTWGACGYAYATGYGALDGWLGHDCRCAPPTIDLGAYPITAIAAVKVDGQIIPDTEYRVDSHRLLRRVATSDDAQPSVRAGWPTCQRLDLPDSEPGTFSVAFTYGAAIPAGGVRAAMLLAQEVALELAPGDNDTRLPQRIRNIVRQGESVTILDPQDVLDEGRTGIPTIDLWLKAVNPAKLARRSAVWSPDMGRTVRPTLENT